MVQPHDFLIEWVAMRITLEPKTGFATWRNFYGRALEEWDLQFASRLLLELKRVQLDDVGLAYFRMGQAGLSLKQNDWKNAELKLRKADELFSKTNDFHGHSWVLMTLGNLYCDIGNWEKAIHYLQRAVDTFEKMNDHYGKAQALQNLGATFYAMSQWSQATDAYRESLNIFLDVGDSTSSAMS